MAEVSFLLTISLPLEAEGDSYPAEWDNPHVAPCILQIFRLVFPGTWVAPPLIAEPEGVRS
jgi:hypothetical protein